MQVDQIRLINVRLSFPDIWSAKSVDGKGEPKFGCSLLLKKDDDSEQIQALKLLIMKVAKEKFGAKTADLIKKGTLKLCLHEGHEKDYEGYGDEVMFVTTSSKRRPTLVDRDRSPLSEEDGRPYAGCYVNAVFRLWAQDNNYGKRINAQLQGLQFSGDGEPFGVAPFNAEEAFDELEKPKNQAEVGDEERPDDDDEIPF